MKNKLFNSKDLNYDITILLPFFVSLTIIGLVLLHINDLRNIEDYYYVYNRARQLLECFQEKKSILFFYNDLNGVGYGSTFFYGYLTLVPFLPFVNMGYDIFFNVYFVVTIFLFCFGALYFTKKFTKNYCYIVTLYMLSTFVVEMYYMVGLITNYFAWGIGFLFLGLCIDFLRDRKNLLLLTVSFYLLLNTHLITTLLCFSCFLFLFIYYFDKTRLKDYFLLLLVNISFCWFYIYNFFIHYDKNMILISNTITRLINNIDKKDTMFFGSNILFMDFLTFKLLGLKTINGYSIMGISLFLICLFLLYKNRAKLKKIDYFILIVFFIGCIIGISDIWKVIMNEINIVFQFPMRYMIILLLLFYIVCFKYVNKFIFLVCFILSIPNLLFEFYVEQPAVNNDLKYVYTSQVINAEYAYEGFDLTFDNFDTYRTVVEDNNKKKYNFVVENGTVYVRVTNDTSNIIRIRVPKLYYKGYVCEYITENETLSLNPLCGENSFIYIDIPKQTDGILKLYFDTKLLDLLFVFNILGIVCIIVIFWLNSDKTSKCKCNY